MVRSKEQTGGDTADCAECEEGFACNSGMLDGLPTAEAKKKIIDWLEQQSLGTRRINYKLRDWLFSRQRYWGEPFPLLHRLGANGEPDGVIEPLEASDLPLTLPDMLDYKPSGKPEPPLGKATDWLTVKKNGHTYRRELNTMPQWAGFVWGIICVTSIPTTARRSLIRSKRSTGCLSISTLAGRSTRCCTCSTLFLAQGTFSTVATFPQLNLSSGSSIRA